ncbi:MAG: Veg family protein [Candidatus Coproplasma sp.]
MIKPEKSVSAIKSDIESYLHKPVTVKLNLGRNKFVTFSANVSGIYPSIFTVEPAEKGYFGKTSYSYTEILCGKVFISLREKGA